MNLGRGLNRAVHALSDAPQIFDFTSAMPSEFAYTRNDTVATFRDSGGQMRKVSAANTPRFDHDINGNALGMLFEGSIQNKLTDRNANPSDTTGWTVGGDGAATLAAVSDPASYLNTAKLSNLCTAGKLYKLDNAAGSTDAYAESTAQFGAASLHTISAWIVATGAAAQLSRSGSGTVPALDIAPGAVLVRRQLSLTPNATSDKMRIVAKPGAAVYFILGQIEALAFATSEIVTSAAAATRAADRATVTSITAKPWFNQAEGALIGQVAFYGSRPANAQVPFSVSDNSTANLIGMRLFNDARFRGQVVAASSTKHSASNGEQPEYNKPYPVGISWKSGEATIFSGPGAYSIQTYSGNPSGLTHLELGCRNAGGDPMFGRIKSLKVYRSCRTVEQIGADAVRTGDRIVIGGGQSNMVGYFTGVETSNDRGKQAVVSTLNETWSTTPGLNMFADGATNTSYLLKAGTASSVWWYDDVGLAFGPCFQEWEKVARACNGRIEAILWDQGEADASPIYQSTISIARYKAALKIIFDRMRTITGNVPVIIVPIGSHDALTGEIYQDIREAQWQLAAENDWIIRGPEKFDLQRTDDVHYTDASYVTQGTRIARKALSCLGEPVPGGVDGPTVASAIRSGTTVTVTITHDGGTDFTPSSGIEGFHVTDNGTPIAVTAALRTNATTITLTLASAPSSGVEKLYYGFAELDGVNYANMVRDNNTLPMSLRAAKITL